MLAIIYTISLRISQINMQAFYFQILGYIFLDEWLVIFKAKFRLNITMPTYVHNMCNDDASLLVIFSKRHPLMTPKLPYDCLCEQVPGLGHGSIKILHVKETQHRNKVTRSVWYLLITIKNVYTGLYKYRNGINYMDNTWGIKEQNNRSFLPTFIIDWM